MVNYTVYCDESRHSLGAGAQYAVIGGLWIETSYRDEFSRQLRTIRTDQNVNGEVKWSKVSRLKFDAYANIVRAFFESDRAQYRAIIVDQEQVDYRRHDGDMELGFYKFYYEMIEKWVIGGNSYNILLDYKNNQGCGRLKKLKDCLVNYGKPRGATINELTSIDSNQSHIAQLCDILTGAIAADANGIGYGTAKQEFVELLTKLRGRSPLSAPSASPAMTKLNVFRIALGGRI